MDEKGFTIEVTSRYEGWWRYNAALMCGCFDAAGRRIGFASSASTVADVGSNLAERPATSPPIRTAALQTMPCDHLVLYLYIIPHTLPADNEIDADQALRDRGEDLLCRTPPAHRKAGDQPMVGAPRSKCGSIRKNRLPTDPEADIKKRGNLAGTGLKSCNDSIYRVVTTFHIGE